VNPIAGGGPFWTPITPQTGSFFHAESQVHTEQLEFVDIYARQISRWRTARPSADQMRELNRMDGQNQQLRTVTEAVLALADELRKGSIMGMSDIGLGLQALLGRGSASPR
jgi:hypothetical protein